MNFRNDRWRLVGTFALVLGASLAAAASAVAQPVRVGSTTYPKAADGGTRRFSSVSYDAANNAYLVAWGIGAVGARFVSADGISLGSPVNLNTTTAGAARVACAAAVNACLVAWIQEPSTIVGRLVRYSAGSVVPLTSPFTVNANGKMKLTSAAPAVAYSSAANEFLVAWTEFSGTPGGPDVRAQRISASGTGVGLEIPIAATGYWEGMPSATYNSLQDEYVVGYYFETGSGADSLGLQRVKPGSGALVGGRSTVFSTFVDLYPEIAYNSTTNQFFAISWGASNPWMLHGWLADGNGQPLTSTPRSLAAQGGGDGIGLAYNPVSNTYLAVFLSQRNAEVWGVEIAPDGVPGYQAQLTSTGGRLSTQPAVSGSGVLSRWFMSASDAFTKVIGQLVAHGSMVVTTSGGGTTGGGTTSCTTVQPASNWTCVNGNWLPPTTTTPTSSCTTVQPASNWTCVNGNWLPPTTTTPTSSCTTVRPASNWTCVNGNWLPPTTTTPTSSCTTVQPASNWTCVNGNWLPPTTTTPTSSCTTVQPAPTWTCVNGNWLPPR